MAPQPLCDYRRSIIEPAAAELFAVDLGYQTIINRLNAGNEGYLGNAGTVLDTSWYLLPDCVFTAVMDATRRTREPYERVLSVLGEVSPLQFTFTPTGNLSSQRPITRDNLANAEASFRIFRPQDCSLDDVYDKYLDNLRSLLRDRRLPMSANAARTFLQDDSITISHDLFRPKDLQASVQLLNGHSIRTFPVPDTLRTTLDGLASSHFVNIAPVYTSRSLLLVPDEWPTLLPGSTVECHFALSYLNIDGVWTFKAHLRDLVILQKPVEIFRARRRLANPSIEWGPSFLNVPSYDMEL